MSFNANFSQLLGYICDDNTSENFQPQTPLFFYASLCEKSAKKHVFRTGTWMEQPWDK